VAIEREICGDNNGIFLYWQGFDRKIFFWGFLGDRPLLMPPKLSSNAKSRRSPSRKNRKTINKFLKNS
jgi:hypothetical protein